MCVQSGLERVSQVTTEEFTVAPAAVPDGVEMKVTEA